MNDNATAEIDISAETREFIHTNLKVDAIGRQFSHGWEGNTGTVAGLCAVEAGRADVAHFMVAQHPNQGEVVYERLAIGKGADGSWRYCGEGAEPDGVGSYKAADDFAGALVALASRLGRAHPTACVFRL